MRKGLLVVAAVAGLGLAGCAQPVGGAAVPDPAVRITTSSPPKADPDSREAQWMNGLCGAGKLLIAAGDTQPQPRTSNDPAVLRQEFIDTTGRLVNVLDAALADLKRLVPAPVGGLDDVIGTVVEHLTAARDSLNHAKSSVESTNPLTVEVYSAAVDEFGRGLASMQKAVEFLNLVDLPDEMKDAAEAAPNCVDGDGFPVGSR